MLKKTTLLLPLIGCAFSLFASPLKEEAKVEIDKLEKIIVKAEKKGINTLKERTALRTAEIFMGYADWDESHLQANIKNFKLVTRYKKEPEKWAKLLPDFEREEIVKMMKSCQNDLSDVMAGKMKRLDTPHVDWSKTELIGDEIVYDGKPVFLADWTWKPSKDEYNEYHGAQDGFFLTGSYVANEKGQISQHITKALKSKKSGNMGFIFLNHKGSPKWLRQLDPTVSEGPGLNYTTYDIHHPLVRKLMSDLIKGTVPYMKDKNYSKLGYMLCNEPHWNTIEKSWASAPFSDKAYEDFKVWLKERHKSIKRVNELYGKNYKSFDDLDIPKMMTDNLRGSAIYFDFMLFNQYRVTDWFGFLKSEIQKIDPNAKTHIKLIPGFWSGNKRDSGIDIEALTHNSEIIGNDIGSCGKWMWGPAHHWEKNYSYDWIELCMSSDFFKSVSPNKPMYNTEGHMLSTGKYRDLYQSTQYARQNYWLAYVHGLSVIQTWYWCRREDGSSRSSEDSNGYAGSNNHQPRIVNEVHATVADLNSVSDKIMAMQRQEKPIRIFYSKASAINKPTHMDDIFAQYESMVFDGMPVGFATEGIIKNNDNKSWDVISVAQTPYLFESDVKALQSYLNQGGVVVIDSESLKTNEYGEPLKTKLKEGKGRLIVVKGPKEVCAKSLEIAKRGKNKPLLNIEENNGLAQKGLIWRTIKGKKGSVILNMANLSKNPTKVVIKKANGESPKSIVDVLTGKKYDSATFNMDIYGLHFLEVK